MAAAAVWAQANGRSEATLATRVVNDGKLFDRLAEGRSCNVATAERFFRFFRDDTSWPSGMPREVADLLDGVDLGAAHVDCHARCGSATSSGNTDVLSGGASA